MLLEALRAMPAPRLLFTSLAVLSVSLAASCSEPVDNGTNNDKQDSLDEVEGDFAREMGEELAIALDDSPGFLQEGRATFETFCAEPEGNFNLTNAAWLAYWAANEYSHLSALGPALSDLGFGMVDVRTGPASAT